MGFNQNRTHVGRYREQIGTCNQRYPVNVTHWDNGLTVIHQQIPQVPVVAIDIWVKAGVVAEPNSVPGLAHFLEHMIFKGTDTLSPREFDVLLERNGSVVNAATGHDYAHYYVVAVVDDIEEIFSHFVDLIMNAAIPTSEVEREREVVLAEIEQAYDNPDWVVYQSVRHALFSEHPYGRPVLGFPDLSVQMSAANIRAFHHQQYCPENMTIVMVGDLTHERALGLVEQYFHGPSDIDRYPVTWPQPALPSQREHCALEAPNLGQARLMMAWLGPKTGIAEQGYGLDLLSVLLTGGRTSRLITDLLEHRGWIQNIHSEFLLQREGGCFTISVGLDADYLEVVETLICDHIYQLGTTCISDEELDRCQQLVVNDYIFGTETVNQLAGLYGYYDALGELKQAMSYPQLIQDLEPQQLQSLAQSYLSPSHYAVTTLQPSQG